LVILALIFILSPLEATPARNFKPYKSSFKPYKSSHFKRVGKPLAKSTLPIIASAALYFGFETLAQTIIDNPEYSLAILSGLGCFFILLLLLLAKLAAYLYYYIHPRASPPQAIELQEINHNINEIINRTDPRRI